MNRATLLSWFFQVFTALTTPEARAALVQWIEATMRVWGFIKPVAIPEPPVPNGGLSFTAPTLALCDPDWTDPGTTTPEEDKVLADIGKLMAADSGKGTQPIFDGKGFLGIVNWLMQNPQALAWIIGLLSRK